MDDKNYGAIEGPAKNGKLSEREWVEEDISNVAKVQ